MINKCRVPFPFPSEFSNRVSNPLEDEKEAFLLNQEYAYRERMDKLSTTVLNLQTATIEAEVLWGHKAAEAGNDVSSLYHKLYQAYTIYFPNALRDARIGYDHEAGVKTAQDILFLPLGDDTFGAEVQAVIERSIGAFRDHLDQMKFRSGLSFRDRKGQANHG